MPNASFFTYWYLHLPSLLLAVLIYLLLGRLILPSALRAANRVMRLIDLLLGRVPSPFAPPADNRLMRLLAVVTDPVVRVVGAITPRVVPSALVILFAVMWLLTARILLHQAVMARRMFG